MELDEKNLNRLKKMLAIMDEDTLTREEFLKHFEKVIELVAKIQQSQSEAISKLETTYEMITGKMRNDHTANLSEIKKEAISQTEFDKIYKEHETMMGRMEETMQGIKSEIDNKMANVQNGKDADEKAMTEKITEKIANKIKIPTIKEIEKELSPYLEEFKKELEEKIQQVSLRTKVFGGSAVNYKFADDEIPDGIKNGVNTIFTLVKSPIALKVFRGGARQKNTGNYTLSNKTITFTVAPLAGEEILCDYRYF